VSRVLGPLPTPAELAAMQEDFRQIFSRVGKPQTVEFSRDDAARLARLYKYAALVGGGRSNDRLPLGVTGAWATDIIDRPELIVLYIEPGSPADGTLEVHDIIIGANGRLFAEDQDPRIPMGYALVEAQTLPLKGVLTLQVVRHGRPMNVPTRLGITGDYSRNWPFDCRRSRRVADDLVRLVLDHFHANESLDGLHQGGSWWNPLLLMACGDDEALARARRAIYGAKLRGPDTWDKLRPVVASGNYPRPEKIAGRSWLLGYDLIILCEYYLLTGDSAVLPDIYRVKHLLEQGQAPSGSWCHGMGMGGYGEVNATGGTCFLGLALAKQCRMPMDPVALPRSTRFFAKFAGGGVPYGNHAPGPYGRTDNGKNGMAAVAFHVLGMDELANGLAQPTAYSYRSRELGHADGLFSFAWGPAGAYCASKPEFHMFLNNLLWYYELARRRDGGLHSIRENHWHQEAGSPSAIGLFLMIPRQKLQILGAPTSVFAMEPPKPLGKAGMLYKLKDWDGFERFMADYMRNPGPAEHVEYARKLNAAYERLKQHVAATITLIGRNLADANAYEADLQLKALHLLLGQQRPEMAAIRAYLDSKEGQAAIKASRQRLSEETRQLWRYQPVVKQCEANRSFTSAVPMRWVTLLPPAVDSKREYLYVERSDSEEPDLGDWYAPDYKANGWKTATGPLQPKEGAHYWVRRSFSAPAREFRFMELATKCGGEIYLNGYRVLPLNEYRSRGDAPWRGLSPAAASLLRPGRNVLAARLFGGQAIELTLRGGPAPPDLAALRKGLVAYWSFDEIHGRTVRSPVRDNLVGEIEGGLRWVDGKLGNALDLAGEARIVVPGFKAPTAGGTNLGSMTIAFWAKLGRRSGDVVRQAAQRNPDAGWRVHQGGFEAYQPKGRPFRAGGFRDGQQWRHYAVVIDRQADRVTVYTDAGAAFGRDKARKDTPIKNNTLRVADQPLVIGQGGDLKVIDELAIWDRALTEEEVQMLVHGGAGLALNRQ